MIDHNEQQSIDKGEIGLIQKDNISIDKWITKLRMNWNKLFEMF